MYTRTHTHTQLHNHTNRHTPDNQLVYPKAELLRLPHHMWV